MAHDALGSRRCVSARSKRRSSLQDTVRFVDSAEPDADLGIILYWLLRTPDYRATVRASDGNDRSHAYLADDPS